MIQVPQVLWEIAKEQSEQAIQALAALMIETEADAQRMIDSQPNEYECDAKELLYWARSMKSELTEGRGRDQLMAAIARRGFSTNSHSGFITRTLNGPLNPDIVTLHLYGALQALADEVADGSWVLPEGQEEGQAAVAREILRRGVRVHDYEFPITFDLVKLALLREGWLMFLEAHIKAIKGVS